MLKAIIQKSGRSRGDWAVDLGISESYLSLIVNGQRLPRTYVVARIEELTNFEVTASSLVADMVSVERVADIVSVEPTQERGAA